MAKVLSRWSVATRVFAAQVAATLLLSAAFFAFLWVDARSDADDDAARLCLAVATALARDPYVIEAAQGPNPTSSLQQYAVAVMDEAKIDFITIMSPAGIRWTHRNPDEIGKQFLGTRTAGLRGESLTETYTGTLGPSVRSVVPVFSPSGEVIALVSAGVTVTNVVATVLPRLPFVIGAAILLVLLGSVAALLGRRYLRRLTGELHPDELTRMLDYYESVLHSIREGLVLVDRHRRIVLYNDEASDLLGLPPARPDHEPIAIEGLELPPSIALLLASGERAIEEVHRAGTRMLVVNQERTAAAGASRGDGSTVMTLRDRTEVARLSGELETVSTMTRALRSQTHEFANRLHTVASLLELDRRQDAIDFIASEVQLSQSLADEVMGAVDNPALAALLLGKSSQAAERGIEFSVKMTGSLDGPSAVGSSELVSLVGNLVDNALDAVVGSIPPHRVSVAIDATDGLTIDVVDSGPGVSPDDQARIFSSGYSTKGADSGPRGFGLGIVAGIVEQRGGTIRYEATPASRFTVRIPDPRIPS